MDKAEKSILYKLRKASKYIAGVIVLGAQIGVLADRVIEDENLYTNMNLLEETIKQDKLKEYKEHILRNKVLSRIFSTDEIDNNFKENLSYIYIGDIKEKIVGGQYNYLNKRIIIDSDDRDLFDDCLYHELTHAILTYKLKNDVGIGEGLTEYISQKFIKKTTHKNIVNYPYYVEGIKNLCIAYGEENIFKSLKKGPEYLAKLLEKDGFSYNELSENLMEMQRIIRESGLSKDESVQNYINLGNYVVNLSNDILMKKFKTANQDEKWKIAERMRKIVYEQKPIPNNDGVLNEINEYVYNAYLEKKKYEYNEYGISRDFTEQLIRTVIFNKLDIKLDDIDNIKLNIVKDSEGKPISFIASFNNIAINEIKISGKGEGCYRTSPFNATYLFGKEKFINNRDFTSKCKALADGYESISEPLVGMSEDMLTFDTFILSTKTGIKCFKYDKNIDSLEELIVEESYKIGDNMVDKNPKRSLLGKLKDKLKKKDVKLLPEGTEPVIEPVTVAQNKEKSDFRTKYKVDMEPKQIKNYDETQRNNREDIEENER